LAKKLASADLSSNNVCERFKQSYLLEDFSIKVYFICYVSLLLNTAVVGNS